MKLIYSSTETSNSPTVRRLVVNFIDRNGVWLIPLIIGCMMATAPWLLGVAYSIALPDIAVKSFFGIATLAFVIAGYGIVLADTFSSTIVVKVAQFAFLAFVGYMLFELVSRILK
jgi:hypothetical protein